MSKRSLFAVLTLFSIFSILFTSAFTPPPPEPKYLQLFRFRFLKTKGYVFVYNMSGEFKKEELIGWVDVQGKKVKLSCWINESDKRVTCSAMGLKNYVGETASVILAGYKNTIVIPEPVNQWFCYGVYDWTKKRDGWERFAEKCFADEEAQEGMYLDLYNPTWENTYTYIYQGSTPCTNDENKGFYYGAVLGSYYVVLCP
jgi:hypothetical protein